MHDHDLDFNRCRNIVAALENLLVQIGDSAGGSHLFQKLEAMREVYELEMLYHQNQMPLERDEVDEFSLFQNNQRKK